MLADGTAVTFETPAAGAALLVVFAAVAFLGSGVVAAVYRA